MEYYFDQHIGIFENAIDNIYCDEVINTFITNLSFAQNRQSMEGTSSLKKTDLTLSGFRILPNTQVNHLYQILSQQIVPLYLTKYYGIEAKDSLLPLNVQDCRIQKTSPSEGYHIWHCEWEPTPEAIYRFLTWTLYLNDVEEGGETEFLYQKKRISPKKGTICLFPSYFTHIHRGNPPLNKDKYIITGWISFIENSPLNNQNK